MDSWNTLIEKYGSRVRSHPVVVTVNASGKSFLPDDTILRNKTIVGLMTISKIDDSGTINPVDGSTLVSDVGKLEGYVSLLDNNILLYDLHPLYDFVVNEQQKEFRRITINSFTPSKSFIIWDSSLVGSVVNTGETLLLHFIYLD